MEQTAIIAREGQQLAELDSLAEQGREFIRQGTPENTRRAYLSDWKDFSGWCEAKGQQPLPAAPETVFLYVTDRAGSCKVSTVARRVASISVAHEAAGFSSPTRSKLVRELLKSIRNVQGVAPVKKAPAVTELLRRMVSSPVCSGEGLAARRNRALLLVGFSGAFRRSEVVSLNREDVEATTEGLVITLRRSKTDQEGEGTKKGLPYGSNPDTCPVRALSAWLDAAGIQEGPLFRAINRHGQLKGRLTSQSVALVVKAAAEAAGLDASLFSGHSLRAGLATSAAAAGVSERAIMNQTGHKSVAIVRGYVRHGSLFRENAAAGVGL